MPVDENALRLIVALVAVLAGWLLAQFTSIFKTYLQRWKVKRLLIEELRDIQRESRRVLASYATDLQLAGAGQIGNAAAVGIANPIFQNYYKDALLGISQPQRLSYQMIHNLVEGINNDLQDLKSLTSEAHRHHFQFGVDEHIKRLGPIWRDKVRVGYVNCAALEWHLKYHLEFHHNPVLTPGDEAHKNYDSYIQEAATDAADLIERGRTLLPEQFPNPFRAQTDAP